MRTDTYNLKIDKAQLFALISKLSKEDQEDLLKGLQKRTYLQRFRSLLERLKTNELSMDEITKEVELVRKKRYDEGKHKI